MENIELVDIYKILLSMQEDIKKLDKKIDNVEAKLNKRIDDLDRKLEQTRIELRLTFKQCLKEQMKEISDFMTNDVVPYFYPDHEKRITNIEKYLEKQGYDRVCETESEYKVD